ncbi:MAG TPA: PqqD family protein [Anaerolineales bacterium]|nr:PqqD family protein [Anaerolineales bacterium]HLB46730.1 PqqD family protein [Anaerolineales bacterium]
MDANARLRRSVDVTYQIVADEAILIRMSTGTYFSLNKVGTDFWNMLDGEQTIEEHAANIASKYNVDAPTVVADVLELAGKMKADDLVDIL